MAAHSLLKTISVLNVEKDISTISPIQLPLRESITAHSYIVSDADEELLIMVEFKTIINLHSIKLYALPQPDNVDLKDASPPKHVHIYKMKHLNINFDDIKSLRSDKSFVCSSKKLLKGQNINLKKQALKFNKTQYLAIYISSNQNDTESTYLNSIQFKGEINDLHKNQIKNLKLNDTDNYSFDRSYKQNQNKLEELAKCLNGTVIKDSNIESQYLFNTSTLYQQSRTDCKLNECWSLKRINYILLRYNLYHYDKEECDKQENENIIDIDNIYGSHYKNHDLLNDFNHLLFRHQHEFEEIYDALISHDNGQDICDLSECVMMRRNHRKRSLFTRNNSKLSNLYYNDDIVRQQLIDRVHCHYLHTFDVGYRFKERDKQKLLQQEFKDMNDEESVDAYSNDQNVAKIDQFIQNINKEKEMLDINQNKEKFLLKTEETVIDNSYSFGYRYFYWKYYKNNKNPWDDADEIGVTATEIRIEPNPGSSVCDWYIEQKYDNFKDEMLNNNISVISEYQWNNLMKTANIHLLTQHVMQYICRLHKTAQCYDMKYGQQMNENHLIALLLYCNFTELQNKFSATYRKLANESDVELKNRHRNFYFFGRYLRECVECFGLKLSISAWNEKFVVYHGISGIFSFPSIHTVIKGPLSTTLDFAVAVNFCHNKGMILEIDTKYFGYLANTIQNMLNKQDKFWRCFDCHWISTYPNELEVLFLGGFAPCAISTIIVNKGQNYCKYIKGIRQMCYFMSTGGTYDIFNIPQTIEEKQIVFRLLSHVLHKYYPNHPNGYEFKSCPQYVMHLLLNHMNAIKLMCFYNTHFDNKLIDYVFKYDYGWINIELIMTLFPNNELIEFDAGKMNMSFIKQTSIYQSILSYLESNYKTTKLREIYIVIQSNFYEKMKSYLETMYVADFAKFNWSINLMFVPKTRILIQQNSKIKQLERR